MPRQRLQSNILLDWFNVTYRSLFLAVFLAITVLGLAIWAYFQFFNGPGPREEAQEAIYRADSKLAEAATYRGDAKLDELRAKARADLDGARGMFGGGKYDDARVAAIRSANISQMAIDMARGGGIVSQEVGFYRVEGDVRIKRAGEFAWEPVEPKTMKLHVGDQVKTSSNSSVKLIYFDGTITTVEPGSLLEIRELSEDPATKVRQVTEKLNWGEVTASTQKGNVNGSFHEVATEKATARTDDASEIRVAYNTERQTSTFDVFSGKIQVSSTTQKETLGAGERLLASAAGELSAKDVFPGAPRPVSPSDQRVFTYDDPANATTTLSWEPVAGAARYRLVIADRPLFTRLLYDNERNDTSVLIEGMASGSYYWKVAAVSATGVPGPYCEPRTFRVSSQRIRDREDRVPPKLTITESVQTGPILILNGKTEPGATLWIDNERIDVADDGSFYAVIRLRKEGLNELQLVAQDPAGNETRASKSAYVESF
jgi:hypothetical protein